MSADNYYFVGKTEDGKFAVSHRFASIYYADECDEPPMESYSMVGDSEGWQLPGDSKVGDKKFATQDEALSNATRRPDWIVEPPDPRSVHDTLEEAVMTAHSYVQQDYVVEYGVVIQTGLVG
jgi:hypothetical protein